MINLVHNGHLPWLRHGSTLSYMINMVHNGHLPWLNIILYDKHGAQGQLPWLRHG